ncbi:uncharacterized protein LOC135076166 [Ostrinia nubilalis]|uniref:uncharacterized protein LOC135076166 n=1 Tax=Ostrinia nubilalis TaxID=29057 RepID=UPI003082572E
MYIIHRPFGNGSVSERLFRELIVVLSLKSLEVNKKTTQLCRHHHQTGLLHMVLPTTGHHLMVHLTTGLLIMGHHLMVHHTHPRHTTSRLEVDWTNMKKNKSSHNKLL